jgi:hypothetical protein
MSVPASSTSSATSTTEWAESASGLIGLARAEAKMGLMNMTYDLMATCSSTNAGKVRPLPPEKADNRPKRPLGKENHRPLRTFSRESGIF